MSLFSRVWRCRAFPALPALWAGSALGCFAAQVPVSPAPATNDLRSYLIEAAGPVEFAAAPSTNWQPARVGLALKPGDRVRTRVQGRAAVQLSDRSVIRLDERTTLEILPPRSAGKWRFGLPSGSLFLFSRERPADIEFDTPLAAGAIRGTEFLLEASETQAALRLALLDGAVSLTTRDGDIAVEPGEDLRLERGRPPRRATMVDAAGAIQWALYYPAVINPDDLSLSADERRSLGEVLEKYQAGDVLGALAAWPSSWTNAGGGPRSLRAALVLAVGQVADAEGLLDGLPTDDPASAALREVIGVVRGGAWATNSSPRTSSGLLARTYSLQTRGDLDGARAAARRTAELAPDFGFARARLAELEFAFDNRRAALAELDRALALSPRLAPAHALRGFMSLEQGQVPAALAAFRRARECDAAYSPAWTGWGLCLMQERKFEEAREAFQAAAALEPQRGLFRAYVGKAASELGDSKAAEREFRLARQFDPNDPTGWLYSALHLWEIGRVNEAVLQLEQSAELNDRRVPFRSRLLLDRDRSVRSANLAALYDDAGLPEVSRRAAARSVAEDAANFSSHLFLAGSYQRLEDANRLDLRFESARQSELLMANLLAPPGGGNLSQQLSQQEHLRFFEPRPVGVSTLTEYGSNGDWRQLATVFGALDGFSYAVDASYESLDGWRVNQDAERQQFTLTLKQRVAADDDAYFQAGYLKAEAGDVARLYDPAQADPGFHVTEEQAPTLYAGWHHAWAPGSHTLFLAARLDDRLSLEDPQADLIFLRQTAGLTTEVQAPPAGPPFTNHFSSEFVLYSTELQHVWQTARQSLVIGGRWQWGDVRSQATLSRVLSGVVSESGVDGAFERGSAYAYGSWRIFDPLQLTVGVAFDHLEYPENTDLPPLSGQTTSREQVSPKAGLLWTPWKRGLLRAAYTQSLGGLFFDNSVRLEPTQVGGFNQTFRSLMPESVAGLVPGSEFETAAVGFDESFPGGTWFGVEAEWLTSNGSRTVGALTNSLFLPIPDSPASTSQTLDFRERNLSVYAAQLLGDFFSTSVRYRLSEARLQGELPDVPDTASGLAALEQQHRSTLNQVILALNFSHPCGLFAQWDSTWYHQENSGYTPALSGDDFWQHNVTAGYRFPRRHAEVRVGVLNLTDTDYRLNPLNLYLEPPRSRTFVASLRLNF